MESNKMNFMSEAVILGICTFIGYLSGYYYEVGFLGYYNIPDSYVEVSIPTILKSILVCLTMFVFLFVLIDVLIEAWRRFNGSKANKEVEYYSLMGFALLAYYFMVRNFINLKGAFWFCFAIPMLVLTIRRFLTRNGQNKGKAVRGEERKSLISLLENKFGRKSIVILGLIILMISYFPVAMRALGDMQARQKTDYLIIKEKKDMAVLSVYKDNVIASEIDLKKKQLNSKFIFVKTEKLKAEMVVTGPLSVTKSVYGKTP